MSTENNSPYVLWLPSWYPCKLTPYDGDFIQRHARATALNCFVHVVHIIRDKEGIITKETKIEESENGNLRETIIYYYIKPTSINKLDGFFSYRKFSKLYKSFLNEYFLKHGLPSLVHVHISFKAGIIARWIRINIGIPYLLTEQWTVYLEEARPRLRDLSLVNQHLISKIITGADLVLPVSNYLAKSIQRRWTSVKCEVVPNVVDSEIFYPADKNENDKLKLIHISTLTYQKDPESLIEAVGNLKKRGINFALDLIGPVSEEISSLIKRHNVTDDVNLKGEMPQSVLADLIRKSDALVLYSRFETFGCVIIEANACGVPVIVPNTQLMHEIVENNVNGVLVHPGSADALADAFEDFSINMKKFSKTDIVKITTEKYSYEKVGKMYVEIYSRYTAV